MKKNDVLLIVGLLILALIGWGFVLFVQGATTQNAIVVVTIDGKEYGRFPLDTDMKEHIELEDGSYNVLEIHDGKADITAASCPDKICVNHNRVSRKNESIVCLPNKVVVTIENGEESDIDAITN